MTGTWSVQVPEVVEVRNQDGTRPEELEEGINRSTAAVVYFNFAPQEGVLPQSQIEVFKQRRN
jgi:hypothetical protein